MKRNTFLAHVKSACNVNSVTVIPLSYILTCIILVWFLLLNSEEIK